MTIFYYYKLSLLVKKKLTMQGSMLQGITDADAKRAIEAVVAGIGELEEPVAIAEAAACREMREIVARSKVEAVGDDPFCTDDEMLGERCAPVEEPYCRKADADRQMLHLLAIADSCLGRQVLIMIV